MSKTLSQEIAENLSYYLSGVDRTCKNEGGNCYYSGTSVEKETEGCFVGRLLSPEDRIKADKQPVDVFGLVNEAEALGINIPNIITDNLRLMKEMQTIHDSDSCIDGGKLTSDGVIILKRVIKNHDLDEKDFEQFWLEANEA